MRSGGVGFKRIVLGLDPGDRDRVIDCDIAGIMTEDIVGRALRVTMMVDPADVPAGLYKAVALSLYDPGPPGDRTRDVVGADAELGTLRFG